jgi:molybdenum cofactor cytidylyltransferase
VNTRVAAVVLAAGLSRRAAPHHKLLLPAPDGSGRSVVRATVEAFCGSAASFHEIVVVTGHERERIESALAGLPIRCVFAPDFAVGMGRSLAAGIQSVDTHVAGFAVAPGDLPWLRPGLIAEAVARFTAESGTRHVLPLASGRRGHPVVLGAWLRPALETLDGDVGARRLLSEPAQSARIAYWETGDEAVLRDVDRL